MTQSEGGLPAVTRHDVERIQAQLRPGSVHPATHLFTLYVRLMEADRRPIGHRVALGHALASAGWERERVRKTVAKKPVEIASWVVPGAVPVDEERERLGEVLRSLGEGVWPEDTIWSRYEQVAAERRWAWPRDRTGLMRDLGQAGFPRQKYKARWCRYVAPERIAKISAPITLL